MSKPNRKEIDYILLPKIFGGYIVNVSRIHYCENVTIFGFHDTTAKLLKYNNETQLCLWSKDDNIFHEVTRNQLNVSIGEKICINVIKEIQFNDKDAGFYKFEKIRPNWLRCSYSNRPLELDLYYEELKVAIEYNGKQHNEYVPYFH